MLASNENLDPKWRNAYSLLAYDCAKKDADKFAKYLRRERRKGGYIPGVKVAKQKNGLWSVLSKPMVFPIKKQHKVLAGVMG